MKPLRTAVLGSALLALAALPGSADAAGKDVFEAKGCAGCHYTEGPAREKLNQSEVSQSSSTLRDPASTT